MAGVCQWCEEPARETRTFSLVDGAGHNAGALTLCERDWAELTGYVPPQCRGGKARAAGMTLEQRRDHARRMAQGRWSNRKHPPAA